MGDTAISWTDKTWNCIRGCSPVSPGCAHCYAEQQAGRIVRMGKGAPTAYDGLVHQVGKQQRWQWTGKVRLVPEHLADPLRWRKPLKIFVNSMSDLFHESLSNEQIAAVFGVMAAAPQHTFQVLTKRAERMRDWFRWVVEHGIEVIAVEAAMWLVNWAVPQKIVERIARPKSWPLPNVWLGVSVEDQERADERIPFLLETPARVRFLSCEPLLGPVSLLRWMPPKWAEGQCPACHAWIDAPAWNRRCACGAYDHSMVSNALLLDTLPWLSWVIVGCESGAGARPCGVEWLRSVRDVCAMSGVAFWLKQARRTTEVPAGGFLPVTRGREALIEGGGSKVKAGGVIELPYLDGVQHKAFPEVR